MLTYKRIMYFVATIVKVSVIILVCFISWVIYYVINAASYALQAEHTFQATLLTYDLVSEYLIDNEGAWPQSWDDLESLPFRERDVFQWPKDSKKLQDYVLLDFDVDINKVETRSIEQFEEQFDAIKPRRPHYIFNRCPEVEKLYKAIQQHQHSKHISPSVVSLLLIDRAKT